MAYRRIMSKQKFRFLDLLFLTILATAIEVISTASFHFVNVTVGTSSLGQMVHLSLACLISMIAIFRWNGFGLIVGVIAGGASLLTGMFYHQALTVPYSLYQTVSYLGLASCLLFIHKRDKGKLRKDKSMMVLYFFIGYLSVEALRVLLLIGSEDYFRLLGNLLSFEIVNVLISFLLYLLALRQDGLVVDMNQYLVEIKELKTRIRKQEDVSMEELCEANEVNEAAILDGGTLSSEDLKNLEDNRRRLEGKTTFFDEENEEVRKYRKKREELKHGK